MITTGMDGGTKVAEAWLIRVPIFITIMGSLAEGVADGSQPEMA
jgi:hypothetical protein